MGDHIIQRASFPTLLSPVLDIEASTLRFDLVADTEPEPYPVHIVKLLYTSASPVPCACSF